MTEANKRIAIIGGTAFIAVLLLLMFRRGGAVGNAAASGEGFALPTVTGPNIGPITYGGDSVAYVIPGLDLGGPDLSMIGACCSDCMQSNSGDPFGQAGPRYSYVFNAGNQGPNVYNYTTVNQTQQQSSSGGFTGIPWASR